MPRQQRYRCVIHWSHRKSGPQWERGSAEGTSIRRAANNYLLGFFSDTSQRKQRVDAHANLTLQIWRLKREPAR